jgi:RNA-splicing ligase RtcB
MFHCDSRGFGHQVATDYLQVFLKVMGSKYGIKILGYRRRWLSYLAYFNRTEPEKPASVYAARLFSPHFREENA